MEPVRSITSEIVAAARSRRYSEIIRKPHSWSDVELPWSISSVGVGIDKKMRRGDTSVEHFDVNIFGDAIRMGICIHMIWQWPRRPRAVFLNWNCLRIRNGWNRPAGAIDGSHERQ